MYSTLIGISPQYSMHEPPWCDGYMTLDHRGGHTCMKCGCMSEIDYYVQEYDPEAYRKKRSQHKRNKWFARKLFGVVDYNSIEPLVHDFIAVVNLLADRGLIKKNVSKYGYYIIRLASRRGIPLLCSVNDTKKGKTKKVFDNNFFSLYKELGWYDGCQCPYYLEWVTRL